MASEAFLQYADRLMRRRTTESLPIEQRRANWDKFTRFFPPPADIEIEITNAGGTPAEWVRWPGNPASACILYMHGGGYCTGHAMGHRNLVAHIAKAAGVNALSIDYRLAPEHPYPAAVEDALAAYTWLSAQVGPENIVLAGDSAGGGLVLALLLKLKSDKIPLPRAAVCISASTDLARTGNSVSANEAIDPIISPASSADLALWYAGTEDRQADPLVSPLYGDYEGLPPLLILVGTREILLDDSIRVAEKAKAAGVHTELEVWQEMIHIWPYFVGEFPEAEQAIDRIGKFIRTQLS